MSFFSTHCPHGRLYGLKTGADVSPRCITSSVSASSVVCGFLPMLVSYLLSKSQIKRCREDKGYISRVLDTMCCPGFSRKCTQGTAFGLGDKPFCFVHYLISEVVNLCMLPAIGVNCILLLVQLRNLRVHYRPPNFISSQISRYNSQWNLREVERKGGHLKALRFAPWKTEIRPTWTCV